MRLVIVGDSTVCNYPGGDACRGWGQFIQDYFSETLHVSNHAKSGRSTKTFIKEGLWAKVLKEKPDFILIQFGHNDSHGAGKPESTQAATDYRDYLRRYIDAARAAGAKPILVTPVQRRTFGRDGQLADSLRPYADAIKAVATEKKARWRTCMLRAANSFNGRATTPARSWRTSPETARISTSAGRRPWRSW